MTSLKNAVVAAIGARQPGAGSAEQTANRADDDADIRRVNLAMLCALGVSGLVLLVTGWKANATRQPMRRSHRMVSGATTTLSMDRSFGRRPRVHIKSGVRRANGGPNCDGSEGCLDIPSPHHRARFATESHSKSHSFRVGRSRSTPRLLRSPSRKRRASQHRTTRFLSSPIASLMTTGVARVPYLQRESASGLTRRIASMLLRVFSSPTTVC